MRYWSALGLLAMAGQAHAEIELLKNDRHAEDWRQRIGFKIGGSFRGQYKNEMGSADDGSYMHKGYDGGSRLRLTGKFDITDDLGIVAFYEPQLDTFQIINAHKHYDSDDKRVFSRQFYAGFYSDTWGELTYGRRESAFQKAVGDMTDKFGGDFIAQAGGTGIDSYYDGSKRTRKALSYQKDFDKIQLFVTGMLPTHTVHDSSGTQYKRLGGGGIGLRYHLNDRWSFGIAENYIRAKIKKNDSHKKRLDQNILGFGVDYDHNGWYAATNVSLTRNFVPNNYYSEPDERFFNKDSIGIESFLSKDIEINRFIKKIRFFVVGTRLQSLKGPHYQNTQEIPGIRAFVTDDFSIYLQRFFVQSTDHQPDANFVRVRYDF